jgi:hypothetical protein
MKQRRRRRIYYSAAQRSEIWDRWQADSIGRRFDRAGDPGIVWRKSVKPALDPVWWASPMGDRPLIGISYLEAVRRRSSPFPRKYCDFLSVVVAVFRRLCKVENDHTRWSLSADAKCG